ncbi:histone-lysine N-methyltransferase SETDB1-A-like isoform X2 [Cynoglossus semilaevis]|uniref:histone-lysine N-methyltransferase SETDB1-A-like isoform X2 n=1 Tax=Cynoglossus semilaevis TaxID=244447 RepID=UPI0007DCA2FE|nr:histone-lysine N-methyltransferase SETDB1-A-like isoform X2 [Cynoglossus semilaevis]
MEEEEIELSTDELRNWIRAKIETCGLISPDLQKKCQVLQSLLEKRERQAARLLQLSKSVMACEAVVKKQYSLLGLEYTDTDDDDDDSNETICEHRPSTSYQHILPAACGHTSQYPSQRHSEMEDEAQNNNQEMSKLNMRPVVSMVRLTERQIHSFCSSYSGTGDNDTLGLSHLDEDWEPSENVCDSETHMSGFKTLPKKKIKLEQMSGKEKKSESLGTQKAIQSVSRAAGIEVFNTSVPHSAVTSEPGNTEATERATDETTASSHQAAVTDTETSTEIATTSVKDQALEKPTNKPAPTVTVEATNYSANDQPIVPPHGVAVEMNVIARRKGLIWQRGKLLEIIIKDSRTKYKVQFEDRGKMLLSGHHIAYDHNPRGEKLSVGARVVISSKCESPIYCPGVLVEVPSRKNRMRFLVFIDDHTPVYVGLPRLYLVCQPLTDPFGDVVHSAHREFLEEYLKSWPNPLQTHFEKGRLIRAEFEGEMQKCEVLEVDCSLIYVIFEKDQHKEWIYRGSMRLEHFINMRNQVDWEKRKRCRSLNLPDTDS